MRWRAAEPPRWLRAVQTAVPVAARLGAELRTDRALREQGLGTLGSAIQTAPGGSRTGCGVVYRALRPGLISLRLTWMSAKSGENPALSRNCDAPVLRGMSQVACSTSTDLPSEEGWFVRALPPD